MQFNMLLLPNKGGAGLIEYFPPERATQDLTSTYVMPDEGQMKGKEGEGERGGFTTTWARGDAPAPPDIQNKSNNNNNDEEAAVAADAADADRAT